MMALTFCATRFSMSVSCLAASPFASVTTTEAPGCEATVFLIDCTTALA